MGCGMSKMTLVQPLMSTGFAREEEETEPKSGMGCGRGDSAGSKGTTDSGVIMENGETLPGPVARKLPTLIVPSPDILQESNKAERLESSEILEQLLSQGIIQAQPREKASGAGEAYNVMMDGRELPRRKPPLRLESLKDSRHTTSKEAIEVTTQAEERRNLGEDELKMRLRIKAACVPGSGASVLGVSEKVTPVEDIRSPSTLSKGILSEPLLHNQVQQAEIGKGEVGDGEGETSETEDGTRAGGVGKINLGVGRVEGMELQDGVELRKHTGAQGREVEGMEEPTTFEITTVKELQVGQMDIEKDSSSQKTEDFEYMF